LYHPPKTNAAFATFRLQHSLQQSKQQPVIPEIACAFAGNFRDLLS
jgi:hypothetical protein